MASREAGEALRVDAELLRKVGLELAELKEMGLAELRSRHLELFGEEPRSKNLAFLRKRISFRLQERVHGGLPPAACLVLDEALVAQLPGGGKGRGQRAFNRGGSSKSTGGGKPSSPRLPKGGERDRDPRLPGVGTRLHREHRGVAHEVEILDSSFRYRGREYRSLSAIAREITGTAWNGFAFFGLLKGEPHGE